MTSLVVAGRLTPTNVALHEACDAIGVGSRLLPVDVLPRRVHAEDIVLSRVDVLPTLDGVEPGLDVIQRLEDARLTVLNTAAATAVAHDKLETARLLAAAGLPHPRTIHVSSGQQCDVDFDPPYVVKPRFGSWGKDVVACNSPRQLRRALSELKGRRWFELGGALVQEMVPNDGTDLRLVVAGGAVIGAINRIAAPGEWRTNVALGGRRLPVVPPPEACALAIAVVGMIGLDLAGVDLMPNRDGYSVLEVNGCVDFTSDYGFDGEDVFTNAIVNVLFPALAELRAISTLRKSELDIPPLVRG